MNNNEVSILDKKKSLRQLVRNLKAEHDKDLHSIRSVAIMQKIEQLPEFKKAKTILCYWSFDGEVATHDAIQKWSGSKRIILPSVDGDIMNLKLYKGLSQLVPGELYAIPEPVGDFFDEIDMIDMVIVPGIAFDRKNNRMGRGKAYYDRFLPTVDAYKVGVCFSFQLFDEIPVEQFDKPMDKVITD